MVARNSLFRHTNSEPMARYPAVQLATLKLMWSQKAPIGFTKSSSMDIDFSDFGRAKPLG